MNIKQMKSAISRFRKADVSVIKDEKLRTKAQKLQAKEGGFTLLELLVVITLLATLAVGALVAYENIGDNAEAVAAANAAATLDSAIRTYRAVEKAYPSQWDSPVMTDGAAVAFLAPSTTRFLGAFDANTNLSAAQITAIEDAFESVGLGELQYINAASTASATLGVPNLAFNESNYAAAQEVQLDTDGLPSFLAVVPNGTTECTTAGYPDGFLDASAATISDNSVQNAFADILEGDECHMVVALGFGSDAASSTSFSDVAISQSPTYVKTDASAALAVNPQTQYARFIGLFHVAEWDTVDGTWDINDKARLLAMISPDGKKLDELVGDMQPE